MSPTHSIARAARTTSVNAFAMFVSDHRCQPSAASRYRPAANAAAAWPDAQFDSVCVSAVPSHSLVLARISSTGSPRAARISSRVRSHRPIAVVEVLDRSSVVAPSAQSHSPREYAVSPALPRAVA